jgi:hypothetical protein
MARKGSGQTLSLLHGVKAREVLADEGCGFALRKSWQGRGERAWRQTVTTFTPKPWLMALARAGQARAPANSQ